MSDKDFEAFVRGLAFVWGGIVGATYKPLMNELSISEIYDVFRTFWHFRRLGDEISGIQSYGFRLLV